MREVAIAEVGLDDENRLFIRPLEGEFDHVHRAGMEVYWDRQFRHLSHLRPPRGWTPVQWFRQITQAAAGEYGVLLKLNAHTTWTALAADLRSEIEAAALERPPTATLRS